MITQDIIIMGLESIKKNTTNKVDIAIINDAIKEIEKYIELVRNVKRFMELYNPPQPDDEYDILRVKLSKVGKEE